MLIGFYTWGDAMMGMGHIFRCLTLADEIRRQRPDARVVFELQDRQPGVDTVRAKGHEVRIWPDDAKSQGPWDILIVDQLSTDPQILQGLRQSCRCLVTLDDAGPGHWGAHLSISTLYGCQVTRPPDNDTLSLGGLPYTLINPVFTAQAYDVRNSLRHIFLTQGGSDTWNMLSTLVRAMDSWLAQHPDVTLHVHTGPAFAHHDDLHHAIATSQGTIVQHSRIDDLPGLMSQMDLAIAAGGVMTLELLAVGVPCITVTAEEKELETVSALAQQGFVHNLGFTDQSLPERLIEALQRCTDWDYRRQASALTRQVLDGKGAYRIIDQSLKIFKSISYRRDF